MTDLVDRKTSDVFDSVIDWIRNLQLVQSKDVLQSGKNIILVDQRETSKDFKLLLGSKEDSLEAPLLEALKELGWAPGVGVQAVLVDKLNFLLVPLSSKNVEPIRKARQAGLDAANWLRKTDSTNGIGILDPGQGCSALDVFEGITQGFFDMQSFKKSPKDAQLPAQISLVGSDYSEEALNKSKAMCSGLSFCRILQESPGNWMNPDKLSEVAESIGKKASAEVKTVDVKEMETLGMGAFLAVGRGSEIEPRLTCIKFKGKNEGKTIALVGKGLTFDAGGISLKPPPGMEEMKYDMSGAAAVLGAAEYFSQVKPECNVICAIAAAENMPSGKAIKPGDVVSTYRGKTVEIFNTDAEGRLVLSDALGFVEETYKPDFMYDIATLTGAVLHALGSCGAAVMGDDKAVAHLEKAAREHGEPFWRLPLWADLEGELKGDVADVCNIAKPKVKAGSIVGGLFLKEFVEKASWAHLDIAGTAWSCQALGYPSVGGCGFGVRTLVGLTE